MLALLSKGPGTIRMVRLRFCGGGSRFFGALARSKTRTWPWPVAKPGKRLLCAALRGCVARQKPLIRILATCSSPLQTMVGTRLLRLAAACVAHVAQQRTGFRTTFARKQQTIRRLDYRASYPNCTMTNTKFSARCWSG
jgi:hypothetical protein